MCHSPKIEAEIKEYAKKQTFREIHQEICEFEDPGADYNDIVAEYSYLVNSGIEERYHYTTEYNQDSNSGPPKPLVIKKNGIKYPVMDFSQLLSFNKET